MRDALRPRAAAVESLGLGRDSCVLAARPAAIGDWALELNVRARRLRIAVRDEMPQEELRERARLLIEAWIFAAQSTA